MVMDKDLLDETLAAAIIIWNGYASIYTNVQSGWLLLFLCQEVMLMCYETSMRVHLIFVLGQMGERLNLSMR